MPVHSQPVSSNSQPALLLVFGTGGAVNKKFPLDRDALIIGKGRGCDLILDAPDISSIHCVVTRNAGGFAVRDCDSRSGLKMNGDRLKDATLHDGDLLQLGPFSFKVLLPPQRAGGSKRDIPARLIRLESKRQNLARLALRLRQRLRQPGKPPGAVADVESSQLIQQAELLQQRMRDCELRADQLDKVSRELASDRAALTKEMEEFNQEATLREQDTQQREQEIEKHLQTRQAELDCEITQRREKLEQEFLQREKALEEKFKQSQYQTEENLKQRQQQQEKDFQQRQQQLQENFLQQKAGLAAPLPPTPPNEAFGVEAVDDEEEDMEKTCLFPLKSFLVERANPRGQEEQEEARRLLLRRRELDFFGSYLRRTRDRLHQEQHQTPKEQNVPPTSESSMAANGTLSQQEHWNAVQAAELLERQQAALARTENLFQEQQAAFAEMLAEMKQLRSQEPPIPQPVVETPAPNPTVEALRKENAELRQLLQSQVVGDSDAPVVDPTLVRELEQLRAEYDLMQKLLDDKNAELLEARQQHPNSVEDMPAVEDVDSYEAELVQFRRQLEVEREGLKREYELMRIKNQEMDEATREMEMEMSKERAEMGRERMRMDRLREEIQNDLERLQRNGGMMERLASVKKLREEIVENRQKPPAHTPPPPNKTDNGNLGGIRNGRTR